MQIIHCYLLQFLIFYDITKTYKNKFLLVYLMFILFIFRFILGLLTRYTGNMVIAAAWSL